MLRHFKFLAGLGLILGVGHITTATETQPNDGENEAVISRNTEPYRATFTPYHSERSAKKGRAAKSTRVQSCNGTWRFAVYGNSQMPHEKDPPRIHSERFGNMPRLKPAHYEVAPRHYQYVLRLAPVRP